MVERIKRVLDKFYTDRCTVVEVCPVTTDGLTRFYEKTVYENIPCKISVKAFLFGENAAGEGNNLSKVSKKAKLFLPPEYTILPGSRVEIYSKGRKSVYGKSGEMNYYFSHNEVMVEIEKKYA